MKENAELEVYVEEVRSNDVAAWEKLYKATFREAYFVAVKVTGGEQEAVDLVHDSYITAFEKIEQLEDASRFQPWLNRIVANKCRDYLRKNKPMLFMERPEEGENIQWVDDRDEIQPEAIVDHSETVRLVAEMIDELPEDQRLNIILYYREEMSISEIAQMMDISEGTVKSRLNYARNKVKAKVESLEKEGIRLHSAAPMSLLMSLLKDEILVAEVPEALLAVPDIGGLLAAGKAGVSSGAAVAGGVAKSGISAVIAKVIAGVTAAAIAIGGGIAIYKNTVDKPEPEETKPVEEAYEAYEELLKAGKTENDMAVNYYAYLDIDGNGVPELITADKEAIPEEWALVEVYTYDEKGMRCCAQMNSRYNYMYHVNDEYLLAMHRIGASYASPDDFFQTVSSAWNDEYKRNEPAIEHGDGSVEFITGEKFEYYTTIPEGEESSEFFIKKAEIVELEENTFCERAGFTDVMDFDKCWGVRITEGDLSYATEYAFGEDGSVYGLVGYNYNSSFFAIFDGTYSVKGSTLTMNLELHYNDVYESKEIVYEFDPDSLTLTQVSDEGLFDDQVKGTVLQFEENEGQEIGYVREKVQEFKDVDMTGFGDY